MPDPPASRDRDVTTLNAGQRDRMRREGRVARALEAAQRRGGGRFVRNAVKPRSNVAKRPPALVQRRSSSAPPTTIGNGGTNSRVDVKRRGPNSE